MGIAIPKRSASATDAPAEAIAAVRRPETDLALADFAHGLSEPLTAIANYVAASCILLDRGDPGQIAAARASLEKARKEVFRAAELVKAMCSR